MEEIRKEPLEQAAAAEETAAAPKKKGKAVWIALGVIAAVLVAGCVAVCTVATVSDRIYHDVSVLGVELGGLTKEEAAGRWSARERTVLESTKITMTMDGEELGTVSLQELGISAAPEAVAEAAFGAGRAGNFFVNGWDWVRSWFEPTAVLPEWSETPGYLKEKADELGVDLAYTVVDGAYRLDETKTDGFYVTKPADGKQIDAAKLLDGLKESLYTTGLAPVECAYATVTAKTIDLAQLHTELCGEVAESVYDKKNGGVTQSRIGVSFDLEQAQALMDAAEPGTEFVVPGTVTYPKVNTETLEKVLFRDVLGQYTTYVSGSWQRIRNVEIAADSCDGWILNPGEVFKYNTATGPTSKENGYYPAPSYVGGKTVDTYGGGVCQVSSTLYYATLLANLEIVLRYNHQYAPDYITFGCDATVYEGDIDYRFRNNTDYPIKVVTSWNGYYLTVKILGTKVDDTYVKIVSKTLESYPYKTIYKETDELAPGKTKVEQTPYTGYYVKTWRNVYDGQGNLISSTLEDISEYDSRDKIVLVGKEVEPEPEPEPTPEPEPVPEPEPTPEPTPEPEPTPAPEPEPEGDAEGGGAA